MKGRLFGVGALVLLVFAVVAAPASAQQVGPDNGGSQVDQYVGGGGQGGGAPDQDPGVGGGGETGGGGELPFTGLTLLTLALAGVALLVIGPALRRRHARDAGASAAS